MTNELAMGMSDLAVLLLSADELGPVLDEAADIVSRMVPGCPATQLVLTLDSGVVTGFSPAARMLRDAHAIEDALAWREVAQIGPVGGEPFGALMLYSGQSGGFDDAAHDAIGQTADMLTVLLSVAIAAGRQAKLTEQLHAALASRSAIDQASGILMGQRHCSRDEAFDMLRRLSQHNNRKLAELAVEMVEKVGGTPHVAPHFAAPAAARPSGGTAD